MKNKIVLIVVATFSSLYSCLGQGALTPPGAPAPMMKSLAQIEPRAPISTVGYVITNSGSYYLTTNLSGGTDCIVISTNDVKLDLCGFTIANGFIGIYISGTYTNIQVSNGTVRDCGGFGVDAYNAGSPRELRFENLNILRNGIGFSGRGMITRAATVQNCTFTGNGSHGLEIMGGLVEHCVMRDNASNGIELRGNGLIRDCQADGNAAYGISCQSSVRILDCMTFSNGVVGIATSTNGLITGCVANNNGSTGISVGLHSTVENCLANNNKYYGITPNGDCVITGNQACGNGQGNLSGGIIFVSVTTAISRIEGNYVRDNFGYGIYAGSSDIVLRNTSGSNTNSNYSPSSGINFAPIQNPTTATNAWGNISF